MPGPPRWRTQLLVNHTLSCQKVLPSTLDERAQDILSFVQRQAQRNPDVVFGDGEERTRDSPEGRKFCRRLAAEGIVVLKNEQDVLPIEAKKVKRVALIGPNMKDRIISGGGSAALKASYIVTPYAGIVDNAPKGIEFDYAVGCYGELHAAHPTQHASVDRDISVQVHPDSRSVPEDPFRTARLGVYLLQPRCQRQPHR